MKLETKFKTVTMMYDIWSVENKEQYVAIGRLYEIVENYFDIKDLQGYGTGWTSDNGGTFIYGIIIKSGKIPEKLIQEVKKEFSTIKISHNYKIPTNYEESITGPIDDTEQLYDKIWSRGPLKWELEEYPQKDVVKISYTYK